MEPIQVGTKTLLTPSLIPSISSFETQLGAANALRLQTTLREPVSLVSAFDLVRDEAGDLPPLCRHFRELGVMFLDSGGYETSRVRRYATYEWSLEAFLAAAEPDLYDYAFSFDLFREASEAYGDYADRLDGLLEEHHDRISPERLIPVVHVVDKTGQERLGDDDIVSLITRIAEAQSSPFVAIPERELGAGLRRRVPLVRRICDALKASGAAHLHILGCGNPVTFAAFVDAGAASCDGLEWCRTYCSSDMRLYHYQHSESIGGLLPPVSEEAKLLLEHADYDLRTAIINLNNFASIVRSIQSGNCPAVDVISKAFGEEIKL